MWLKVLWFLLSNWKEIAGVVFEVEKVLKAEPDKRLAAIKKIDLFCQFKDTCKSAHN